MTAAEARYTSGTWIAVVSPSQWLLVDLPASDDRVADLWAARGAGMEETLDILLRQGLKSLPGFVLAEHDGESMRYVVRQPGSLKAKTAVGDDVIESSQQGLWDQGVLDEAVVALELVGDPAHPGVSLLMRDGVALAASIAVASGSAFTAHATPSLDEVKASTESPIVAEASAVDEVLADVEPADDPPPDSPPAPGQQPSPLEAPVATDEHTRDDHADTYYQLLVSSTVDRDALLAQLSEEGAKEELPEADPAEARETTPEPAPLATVGPDATKSWDPNEVAPVGRPAGGDDNETVTPPAGNTAKPLIDGVPWLAEASSTASPPISPSAAPSNRGGSALPTFRPMSTPPSAPAAPPIQPPTLPHAPSHLADDVDPTAVTTNRQALLNALSAAHQVGPTVLAIQCPVGHPNPVYAPACRVCGAQLAEQTPHEIPRPVLGRLTVSNGSVVTLDRGVVFGRYPESDITDPAQRPHLVRLIDSTEISRMHASVTLEGWQLLLRDLGSSNGTLITTPGSEPVMVRPLEDHPLEPGSVVSLADVVSFTFEVTP